MKPTVVIPPGGDRRGRQFKRLAFAPALGFLAWLVIAPSGWSRQAVQAGDFSFALLSGDVEAAARFIGQNTNIVNAARPGTDTPLILAVRRARQAMVELLVTNHAAVNAHGMGGRTALHVAADQGNAQMVEYLLEHGADPNEADKDGFTPIIRASNSPEVVKLLLAHGADINAHAGSNTLLTQALRNPRAATNGVRDLVLARGADVTAGGQEAFQETVLFGDDTNLVRRLTTFYLNASKPERRMVLAGVLVIAMDQNREKMASAILSVCLELQGLPLQRALASGNNAAVGSMLATNAASAKRADLLGWTPLHIAALVGNTEAGEALLSQNAEVNARDDLGNTPLHWATYFGRSDLVALLLSHKADVNVQGNRANNSLGDGGETPLDLAILEGFTGIAATLITNGANLGPHKSYKDTPLHTATLHTNLEVMKLLIAHGADVNARRFRSGQSPLDIAVQGKSPEAARLLIDSGARLQTQMVGASGRDNTLLHIWARCGNTNIADQLAAAGLDVNARNGEGKTPLHISLNTWNEQEAKNFVRSRITTGPIETVAEHSGREATWWLLNHGAGVNGADNNGETPLHVAATGGNLTALEWLLDHGAEINAVDKSGNNALARVELLKLREGSGRRWMNVDIRQLEDLLLVHGAVGPIQSLPSPTRRR